MNQNGKINFHNFPQQQTNNQIQLNTLYTNNNNNQNQQLNPQLNNYPTNKIPQL